MLSHFKTVITKWPHTWTTFKFGCLFAGSELTQQIIIKKIWSDVEKKLRTGKNERDPLDWANIGRYAIWGFLIFPHILRSWYKILDKKFVGNTWKAIISKTAIDQLIFPLPILGSFYIFLSALEGKTNSIDEVMEECNVKLWATLKARYCFMIPAQFINFAIVPPQHRVIYVGCTTFVWLNVLCIYKRLELNDDIFKQ